jgi:inner membrane protein
MHPVTHFLTGWMVGNAADLSNRDRIIVALVGTAPDIDGIGIVVELATLPTRPSGTATTTMSSDTTSGLLPCVFSSRLNWLVVGGSPRHWPSWPSTFTCSAISWGRALRMGTRGRFPTWQLAWSGQWPLSSWQNNLITAVLMAVTLYLAWRSGFSPLGLVSERADRVFVGTLRARFGMPRISSAPAPDEALT